MLQATFFPLIAMILTSDIARAVDETHQEVPLLDDGVMIRVPVNAFGQTLYFMVDTGFTVSAIDAKYKSQLGEAAGTYRADGPLGTNNVLPVFYCPEMSIAGKSLELRKIACLDLRMARLVSGQSCDGVLGMDFLSQNIASIDFDKRVFSLNDTVPEDVRDTFVAVPLKRFNQHYTAEVSANHTQILDLLIDTGDNSSMSLNCEGWQKVFSPNQTNEVTVTVAGVGNQVVQSKIGVVGQLAVEGLTYTNLHATYIHNPGDPSHLGLGFFRRHNVTFDFANQMLYLEPGQKFSMSDKEDMSGLHLLREGGTTIVYSVDENSPAFADGIRAKDTVESVNGQNTSSLTMKVIRRALQSHDGDKVTLQVRRGDDLLDFEFALKKAI
jgi:membrane-associated protease RseP (regulator of RpoE activity)